MKRCDEEYGEEDAREILGVQLGHVEEVVAVVHDGQVAEVVRVARVACKSDQIPDLWNRSFERSGLRPVPTWHYVLISVVGSSLPASAVLLINHPTSVGYEEPHYAIVIVEPVLRISFYIVRMDIHI